MTSKEEDLFSVSSTTFVCVLGKRSPHDVIVNNYGKKQNQKEDSQKIV